MESGGAMAIAIPKQFAGFGLAVAIISVANHFGLVDLFAQSATRAISKQAQSVESANPGQPNEPENGLQMAKDYAEHQKMVANSAAMPFKKEVINVSSMENTQHFGPVSMESQNVDTVFIIRDKATKRLRAVVQVPKKQTVNISLPIGQYTIQYAQNNYIKDAPWQGLNKFWGYGTTFLESKLELNVTLVQYPNNSGYFIRGTGIIVGVEDGTQPDELAKNEFVKM